ncbi:NAD(P)-dependent dehydrogenase (short-subunit alcohol dehydrogenase family) [Paucibacter oligotrophus]|uniref:NAD(P)-dependent dehydrogenase (Short-subunit alcohol dehydrogenase family) n=1 Tax=Roseateles oligotrophus TaxID=1769250 RepID=A0A840LC87_9BURK|nr:SDR family oxidoreductase [Roseateles oligotrophus]MBB4846234.1 NAD(P)-dependent dehydrogenase (short-subunit alcohol dehydrogenase family) [Roseateles oligotrophus]
MENQELDNWTVVTGGTDGIGFAIAERFARGGSNVIVIGKEKDLCERAAARLSKHGTKAVAACIDFSQAGAIEAAVQSVRSATKRVCTLVNNVGMIRFTPLAEATEAEFDAFVNVNIRPAYFLSQALLPELRASRGNVINMTSYFASKMLPGRPSTLYSMTKGAIKSLSTAMAYELGPQGVRVNAIAPGTVDSPGRSAEIEKMPVVAQERLAEYNRQSYPIGRIGEPEDVANLAFFLSSAEAAWITGSTMAVDGGLTAG